MTGSRRRVVAWLLWAAACSALPSTAHAVYGATGKSYIDPEILRIDESEFLGAKLPADIPLRDSTGATLTLGDMLGKPLLLVLSYYNCDGACPTINRTLRDTLERVSDWRLGEDYRVLTLSFDSHDDAMRLGMFVEHVGFRAGPPDGWRIALFEHPDDIARVTGTVGFRYFWSPPDGIFLHPDAYVLLTPEGRVARYLYTGSIEPRDVALSITKAYGNEISTANLINYLVGACYSYSFEEGKYALNYPVFIALGSLALGLAALFAGSIIVRRRARK